MYGQQYQVHNALQQSVEGHQVNSLKSLEYSFVGPQSECYSVSKPFINSEESPQHTGSPNQKPLHKTNYKDWTRTAFSRFISMQ